MYKCPDSEEELDVLVRMIPMCRKELHKQVEARIESGAAIGLKDASRQLSEETGRNPESIRRSVQRERADKGATLSPLTECNCVFETINTKEVEYNNLYIILRETLKAHNTDTIKLFCNDVCDGLTFNVLKNKYSLEAE